MPCAAKTFLYWQGHASDVVCRQKKVMQADRFLIPWMSRQAPSVTDATICPRMVQDGTPSKTAMEDG
ncbi:hypothetical protein DUNSADRAFT_7718 [Dunaliella salina]|uniref:Uncharacterized protein n=1 Tax=Dunaliella salina TaxID=3046 RepID=A0ABQ7GKU1_DUNSA|nr:hypothetical protein DUNSADRAFT_7718 [Dunaliella salina]|eukprot:KAF5835229.1 hypothetical protein DUNSADRAFT_7718 [Dunaliella salina]